MTDVDALKRELADAIRTGDKRWAADLRAQLDRLTETRETTDTPPDETR